ncbi:hypothetical protein ACOMHN_042894 [Nucella lapillus]
MRCVIFSCFRNPPNADMDYEIFNDKKSSGLKAEREKNHDHHPVSVDQVCKSGVHATCPCKDLGHQPAVKTQG